MQDHRYLPVIAALVTFFASATAFACLHSMAKTETSIAPADLEAIVAWHDGIEDLVVALGYHAEGGEATRLAYVLPVPTRPSHYAVTDTKVFDDLRRYVDLKRVRIARSRSMGERSAASASATSAGLREFPPLAVGPYEIHPLQASGEAGLEALQKWMTKNGFKTVNEDDARYYVEREWTFLAISVDPEKAVTEGTVPPLHVRFDSERAVFPLKLLRPRKPIGATIYVLTEEAMESATAKAIANTHGFEVVRGQNHTPAPGSPREPGRLETSRDALHLEDAPGSIGTTVRSFSWKDPKRPRLAVLHTTQLGSGPADPRKWKEDLAIPPVTDGKLLGKAAVEKVADVTDEKVVPADPDVDDGARPPTQTVADVPAETTETEDDEEADEAGLFTSCAQTGKTPAPTTWLWVFVLLMLLKVVPSKLRFHFGKFGVIHRGDHRVYILRRANWRSARIVDMQVNRCPTDEDDPPLQRSQEFRSLSQHLLTRIHFNRLSISLAATSRSRADPTRTRSIKANSA